MTQSMNINICNRDARVIDLYPDSDDMSWYGIYHRVEGETDEWHIKAININEALRAFFFENKNALYSEIFDIREKQ